MTAIQTAQNPDLKLWIGKREVVTDHITIPHVRRIRALLDHESGEVRVGDVLPTGWHSTLCPPLARQSEIGADGHPKRGPFIPPAYARRLAAAMDITFHGDLCVGDEVRRESIIEEISSKSGRSGELIFMTIKNEFYGPRGLAVSELQRAVFRDFKPGAEASPVGVKAADDPEWERIVTIDPVMVFRYAAIAFSGHRIHYDYKYSTEIESYADVMSSGGLNLLLLFDLARQNGVHRFRNFSSKNLRPVYVNEQVSLCGKRNDANGEVKLWMSGKDGNLAVTATAAT